MASLKCRLPAKPEPRKIIPTAGLLAQLRNLPPASGQVPTCEVSILPISLRAGGQHGIARLGLLHEKTAVRSFSGNYRGVQFERPANFNLNLNCEDEDHSGGDDADKDDFFLMPRIGLRSIKGPLSKNSTKINSSSRIIRIN
jgi:hypothetical protein